ncbi:anti-sigma factor domain-containing protein [Halobacillus karajensis]|nr:anti-sigma factor domain-containing protein [Halobacillus karajensis]
MKKGIVMEQQKEYMIVMTSDGKFHRAENIEQAEIGMEVHFKTAHEPKVLHQWAQVLRNHHTRVAVVAIVFLMTLFPIFSWYGSNKAYAYVNIDINPSVELELNDKMQVIDVIPQNREAKEVVSSLDDWEKNDASAVTFELIQLSQERGYVNDAHQVLIGISYLKENINQDYTEEMETFLMDRSEEISIATFLVPEELRKKAHEQKASVNEMMADRIDEKKRNKDTEEDLPVTVEDDDKEIIQSFYKEESSNEEQKESDASVEPIIPVSPHPHPPVIKDTKSDQANQQGNDHGPGQQKKEKKPPVNQKDKVDKKQKKKKDEKTDNQKEQPNEKHKHKSPSPKDKGKGPDNKPNHHKDKSKKEKNHKKKPSHNNGKKENNSKGKHS